jgi:hypothetical protein
MRRTTPDREALMDDDDLRIPLDEWTDPAGPDGLDGLDEDNIVRSID